MTLNDILQVISAYFVISTSNISETIQDTSTVIDAIYKKVHKSS